MKTSINIDYLSTMGVGMDADSTRWEQKKYDNNLRSADGGDDDDKQSPMIKHDVKASVWAEPRIKYQVRLCAGRPRPPSSHRSGS